MLNKFTDYCLGLKQHLIDNMSEFSRDTYTQHNQYVHFPFREK